jgi:hypothetical protein
MAAIARCPGQIERPHQMFETLGAAPGSGIGHPDPTQRALFERDVARGGAQLQPATERIQRGGNIVEIEQRGPHANGPFSGGGPIATPILERGKISLMPGRGRNPATRMLDLDQRGQAAALHRQVADLATDRETLLELGDCFRDLAVAAQRLGQTDHDAALQTEIGRAARGFGRLPLQCRHRLEIGVARQHLDLSHQRFRDTVLVVEPLRSAAGAAEERLRLGALSLLAQEITEGKRGIDLGDVVVFLVTKLELLPQQGAGPFRVTRVERAQTEPAQSGAAALNVSRALRDPVGISQEPLALMAGIVAREQGIESQRRIDDLIVEALGARRGIGEPGQDDGILAVLVGLLFDHQVEALEILGREAIEHGGVPDLRQSTLNRSLAVSYLTRDEEHGIARAVPAPKSQPVSQ